MIKKFAAVGLVMALLGLFGCGESTPESFTPPKTSLKSKSETIPWTDAFLDPILEHGLLSVDALAERFGEPKLTFTPMHMNRTPQALIVLFDDLQFEFGFGNYNESWRDRDVEKVDRTLPMQLDYAIVHNDEFTFPRGIRIGDSMEQVRAAYPGPPRNETETSDGGTRLTYVYSGNHSVKYTFIDGYLAYTLFIWHDRDIGILY